MRALTRGLLAISERHLTDSGESLAPFGKALREAICQLAGDLLETDARVKKIQDHSIDRGFQVRGRHKASCSFTHPVARYRSAQKSRLTERFLDGLPAIRSPDFCIPTPIIIRTNPIGADFDCHRISRFEPTCFLPGKKSLSESVVLPRRRRVRKAASWSGCAIEPNG
jgi:hypothetical protein